MKVIKHLAGVARGVSFELAETFPVLGDAEVAVVPDARRQAREDLAERIESAKAKARGEHPATAQLGRLEQQLGDVRRQVRVAEAALAKTEKRCHESLGFPAFDELHKKVFELRAEGARLEEWQSMLAKEIGAARALIGHAEEDAAMQAAEGFRQEYVAKLEALQDQARTFFAGIATAFAGAESGVDEAVRWLQTHQRILRLAEMQAVAG